MTTISNPGYLLHHLAALMDHQSDVVLQERFGIGFSQYKVLMILSQRQGIRQCQIADNLGQTEASISRQIKLMLSRGLVQSRKSEQSKREHRITLTGKGSRLIAVATDALNSYHGPVYARLGAREQQSLLNTLSIMHEEVCQNSNLDRCQHTI